MNRHQLSHHRNLDQRLPFLAWFVLLWAVLGLSIADAGTAVAETNVPSSTDSSAVSVSHWPFDDGTGTTATNTVNPALNGALYGGASWSTDVATLLTANPYAIELDGSTGFVEIPDDAAIDFATNEDFSIAFWTKPAATQNPTGSNSDNSIIEKWSDSGEGYPYVVRYINQLDTTDAGKILVGRYDTNVGSALLSTVTVDDGNYHHVAMVRGGGTSGTLSLYIDGVLQGSIPDGMSLATTNSDPLFVGKRGNNINFYSGLVDDLRIYDSALTGNEVAYLGAGCADIGTAVATETELNEAITCFNNLTVAGTYTINLTADIFLTASTTAISNTVPGVELTIEGDGHTVDGQDQLGVRPFEVAANSTVTLNQITIRGGNIDDRNVDDRGGGLINAGTTTVRNSTITGNHAYIGGGIENSGTMTIADSAFHGNSAAGVGAGIANLGTMTVINSTFSDNLAQIGGGGIYNGSDITITNSTLSGNGGLGFGGGILTEGGTVNLNNSVIANSLPGGDCRINGPYIVNAQYSLIENTGVDACNLSNGIDGNIVGQDPNLGGLQDNGGPTLTHALLPGSQAINAGSNALAVDGNALPLLYDQRGAGFPRVLGPVDMGAIEYSCTGISWSANDEATLNNAITCFNTVNLAGSYTVDLTADIVLSSSTTRIDNPTSGAELLIRGNGNAVDGQDQAGVRPFEVAADTVVTLDEITIRGGNVAAAGEGGAIRNEGFLTVQSSTLSGNRANAGGGIWNNRSLAVIDTTISGNVAYNGDGGGIWNDAREGEITVTNSTISGNHASFAGGIGNFGQVTVTNSTIADNRAIVGGGTLNSWILTVNNTIIANNIDDLGESDCEPDRGSGTVNAAFSLIEANFCDLSGGIGNITGQDPNLGP
ncbi:MAG: LamG-like jellyroll fold domain-containing protein, partial [Caldilineaceae bacterium]